MRWGELFLYQLHTARMWAHSPRLLALHPGSVVERKWRGLGQVVEVHDRGRTTSASRCAGAHRGHGHRPQLPEAPCMCSAERMRGLRKEVEVQSGRTSHHRRQRCSAVPSPWTATSIGRRTCSPLATHSSSPSPPPAARVCPTAVPVRPLPPPAPHAAPPSRPPLSAPPAPAAPPGCAQGRHPRQR